MEQETLREVRELDAERSGYWVRNISEFTQELGCLLPVFITQAAWETCVEVPDDVPAHEKDGRLWNLLVAFTDACDGVRGERTIPFSVAVDFGEDQKTDIGLVASCCRSTSVLDGQPVIVLMLQSEA